MLGLRTNATHYGYWQLATVFRRMLLSNIYTNWPLQPVNRWSSGICISAERLCHCTGRMLRATRLHTVSGKLMHREQKRPVNMSVSLRLWRMNGGTIYRFSRPAHCPVSLIVTRHHSGRCMGISIARQQEISSSSGTKHGPMQPTQHIKALRIIIMINKRCTKPL